MWILGFSGRPSNQHVKGIDEARPLPLLFQEGHLGLKVLRRNAPHLFLAHVRCDVIVVLRIEFKFSLRPREGGGGIEHSLQGVAAYLAVLQEFTEATQEHTFPTLVHQFPPDQRGIFVFPAIFSASGLQPLLPRINKSSFTRAHK